MDAILCPYQDAVGLVVFALFFFGVLALMYRLHGRSWAAPAVLGVMFGGIVMTELPGFAVNAATIGIMILVPAAIMYIYHRLRPV